MLSFVVKEIKGEEELGREQFAMCGFITRFQSKGRGLDPSHLRNLEKALEKIHHRGPDDSGTERSYDSWMGFRRLSFQDLSHASHQPMTFSHGRHMLTFNGEIYNFHELKAQLSKTDWRSTGDTEVLGEYLLQKGVTETLSHLRGMYAFVFWDKVEKVLIAARDPFGIKPLYYSQSAQGDLILGSEWRSVFQALGGTLELDEQSIDDYLRTGSVAGDRTMSMQIRSLLPGHLLQWNAAKSEIRVEPYFNPTEEWSNQSYLTSEEAIEKTRAVLADTVKMHLVSDVPVGAFLSGGLDSSMMVALMREAGQSSIKAFSIGYEGKVGVPDETDAAEQTAKFYGCDFTKLSLSSKKLHDAFDGYLNSMDQPTGDGLNTYLVSRLAATEVKTTLSGLGADEWFAGYNYHRLILLAQSAPFSWSKRLPLAVSCIRGMTRLLPPNCSEHKIWKALQYASGVHGHSLPQMQASARTLYRDEERRSLLVTPQSWDVERGPSTGDWLKDLLLLETTTYLPNTLLRDNDFTSMSQSLELRVPCVDREVFKLAGQIAPKDKLNLQQGKSVLRKAFAPILPPWIVKDQAKKTFTLPLMKWLREEPWKTRVYDTLTSARHLERGLFKSQEVHKLLDQFYANAIVDKRAWRITQKVWLLFILESWFRANTDS